MTARMDFLTWRVSYQSDEQALRAAFTQITTMAAELALVKAELLAVAGVTEQDIRDVTDFIASGAAPTLATADVGITRSPGRCPRCRVPLGATHTSDCIFANRLIRRSA